jgi:hypothetical protein
MSLRRVAPASETTTNGDRWNRHDREPMRKLSSKPLILLFDIFVQPIG